MPSSGTKKRSLSVRPALLLVVAALVAVNLVIGYHYIKDMLGSGKPMVEAPEPPAPSATDPSTAVDASAPSLPPSATDENGGVDAKVHVIEREAHRWDKIEADLPMEKVEGENSTTLPVPTHAQTTQQPIVAAPTVKTPAGEKKTTLSASTARRYELQGIAEFNRGNYLAALEMFQYALQDDPKNRKLKMEIALAYNKIGWANVRKGEYWDAIGNFKEAIHYHREEAGFYLGLGLSYYQMKNYDSAVVELQTAMKMAPKDPMPYQLLGQIYYQRDEVERALEYWEKALVIDPLDTSTRGKIAKARRELSVDGDFKRATSSHFTIRYEGGERAEIGRKVLQILEDAYNRLGRELSHYPSEEITVFLYSNQQFRDVTKSPGWAGGAFDGKIRIPIGSVSEDNPQLERAVRHEYTHALLYSITPSIPTWLNEGLARYFERGDEGVTEKKALRGIARRGLIVPLSSLEAGFSGMSREQAWQAYAQSLSVVTYLVERYGLYDTKRLVTELSRGKNMRTALSDVFFISYEDFQESWKKYLDE